MFARLSSTVSNDDLRAEIERLLRSDNEFASDRDLHEDVVNEVTTKPDEVLSHCHDELDQLRRASDVLRRAVGLYGIGTSLALTIAVVPIVKIWSAYSTANARFDGIMAAVSALGLAAAVVIVRRVVGLRRRRAYAKLQAIATIRVQLRAAIRESITALIGSERRWSNIVRLTDAPALIEVDLKDTISSQTYTKVAGFVTHHAASAIGLAGPRGAGKSTLMRQLREDRSLASISIQVPAPTHVDTSDLIRVIHTELARSALAAAEPRTARQRAPHHDLVTRALPTVGRLLIPTVKIAGGLILVLGFSLLYFADRADTSVPDYGSSKVAAWHLGWTGVLAVAGLCVVFGVIAHRMWQVFQNRTRLMNVAPTVGALAQQQLQLLRWTTALESTAKTSAKIQQLGFEGQNKLSRAERPQTPGEGVRALREFLTQLHALTVDDQVKIVICIDELDKNADPADAVAIINGIKDLFHLTNVHVLVSVSTDALASFAARGVPLRDVFDSSFDTMVTLAPLTFNECRHLVSRRAPGFPSSAVMFAYAWSGGNARDLIRTARACVELPRRKDKDVALTEVVRTVLHTDLLEVIDAALRKLRAARLDPEYELVFAFRELLDDVSATLDEILAVALADAPLPIEQDRTNEAEILAAALDPYARIAGLTALLFAQPRTPEEWQTRSVGEAVHALARARTALGSHPREIGRLINVAVQRCSTVLGDDRAAQFTAVPPKPVSAPTALPDAAGNGHRPVSTTGAPQGPGEFLGPGGPVQAPEDPDAVPLLG